MMPPLPDAPAEVCDHEQMVHEAVSPDLDKQQLIEAAERLLTASHHEGWSEMTDEQLHQEINKLRTCITSLDTAAERCTAACPRSDGSNAGLLLDSSNTAGHVHSALGAAAASSMGAQDATATAASEPGVRSGDYELGNIDDLDPTEWQVPPHCVPIHANVTTYDWRRLYEHTQFDVIMMDPPWQLATANPTRGVSLGYSQLTDSDIANLPIHQLQSDGFLFVWVINAKYKWTLDLFEKWGYKMVDEIVWVKMTVNRRLAKSHGYYLQHAKEVCLVGKRGNDPPGLSPSGVGSDIIFSERRGQSQKPEEIYDLIEALIPNGRYLEIFARKNNLRNYWVSIGNEVTGTGLPEEDMDALKQSSCIPNAVYGRGSVSRV